ncbi:acyl-CoA dehydrogenase family protein [Streptomyces sp. NPDC051776]|uniref:acyl-CoA dehydrogenase family protein n=1 Tax=Streptomyces sp. NPDC051776 TaxID=3155414 RepID=UPI003413C2B8
MRFLLDEGQRDFDRTLDRMLGAADTPGAVRAWSEGDHTAGRGLWERLGGAGVFALAVPEAYGGAGMLPVELAVAFVQLGRHAVPGPVAETVATGVLLATLADAADSTAGPAKDWLPGIASGRTVATLCVAQRCGMDGRGFGGADRHGIGGADGRGFGEAGRTGRGREDGNSSDGAGGCGFGGGPYALDADCADAVFAVGGDALGVLRLSDAPQGDARPEVQPSLDPARRLSVPHPGGELPASGTAVREAAGRAMEWAAFATAAQALGAGLALVERTVAYVKQRTQFGVPIGSFQAVKHQLADALLGLEFARPLLYGAAVALSAGSGGGGAGEWSPGAEIAAAKAAAGEAAYAAARTALQLHGAIGYTAECDLSLWINKARALRAAWGTPSQCRARVLAG